MCAIKVLISLSLLVWWLLQGPADPDGGGAAGAQPQDEEDGG
jgi:hypothetical protein